MAKDSARSDAAGILGDFEQQIGAIARAARRRAELTATGYAEDGRVAVTVNADGAVLDTRFSGRIEELPYPMIAAAVTAAAQSAAAEVARQAEELLAPVAEQRARMPALSELIADVPDLPLPDIPAPPRPEPGAPPRGVGHTEAHESWRAEKNSGITDQSW